MGRGVGKGRTEREGCRVEKASTQEKKVHRTTASCCGVETNIVDRSFC